MNSCCAHLFVTRRVLRCIAQLCLGLAIGSLIAPTVVFAAEPEQKSDPVVSTNGPIVVHPIHHATCVMVWKERTIYVDPVGSAQRFAALPRPDVILITDLHDDHLDTNTLAAILHEKTRIIAPAAVVEKLPDTLRTQSIELANGGTEALADLSVEAVPMYNLSADRKDLHSKGRGNGYVVTLGSKRVYFSGDTEDIPEMRALKNIDLAFISMNLPDTMSVDQAASVVREFKPRIVCPYHCRGSDLERFKQLVGNDAGVEVVLRDWYRAEKESVP